MVQKRPEISGVFGVPTKLGGEFCGEYIKNIIEILSVMLFGFRQKLGETRRNMNL